MSYLKTSDSEVSFNFKNTWKCTKSGTTFLIKQANECPSPFQVTTFSKVISSFLHHHGNATIASPNIQKKKHLFWQHFCHWDGHNPVAKKALPKIPSRNVVSHGLYFWNKCIASQVQNLIADLFKLYILVVKLINVVFITPLTTLCPWCSKKCL